MRNVRTVVAIVASAALCLAGCSSGAPSGPGPTANGGAGPTTNGGAGPTTNGGAGPTTTSGAGGGDQSGTVAGQSVGATPGTITFHVKVSFTGAYTFTDSYDSVFDPTAYAGNEGDPAATPKSCADVAKRGTSAGSAGNSPSFAAPSPDTNDGTMASGQNSLGFQADVGDYTGPKTYTGQQIDSSGGMEISNTPKLPEDGGGDLNFGDVPNTSSLTENADGSGTLHIVGWEDSGSRTVSGTLTWTCSA